MQKQLALVAGLLAVCAAQQTAAAAVPGANGRLAFVRNAEIYTVRADGSDPQNLTNGRAPEYSPAWSPDGIRIAFASRRDGIWRIYVMNRDGSDPRQVTTGPWDRAPSWSSDGSRIIFNRSLATGGYLHVVAADGSGDVQLAMPNVEVRAGWSPDGQTIAYAAALAFPWQIYLMNPDGSGQRPLPVPAEGWDPDWSPDGQRLAFTRATASGPGIFTMNRDGGNQARLTPTAGERPAWSPDGTKLAFVSGDQLKVVTTDGSGETTLVSGITAFLGKPDWQSVTDVGVGFTARPASGRVGRLLSYRLSAANRSPRSAESVQVTLRLTGAARVVSRTAAQGSCTGTRVVTCSLGTLAAQSAASVRLTLKPLRPGVLSVDAKVNLATPDATDRNDRVLVRTNVRR